MIELTNLQETRKVEELKKQIVEKDNKYNGLIKSFSEVRMESRRLTKKGEEYLAKIESLTS